VIFVVEWERLSIKNFCTAITTVTSRTALKGLPFKDVDKDKLLSTIKRHSVLFFVKILDFSSWVIIIIGICQTYI